jgi:hypothetical protein
VASSFGVEYHQTGPTFVSAHGFQSGADGGRSTGCDLKMDAVALKVAWPWLPAELVHVHGTWAGR